MAGGWRVSSERQAKQSQPEKEGSELGLMANTRDDGSYNMTEALYKARGRGRRCYTRFMTHDNGNTDTTLTKYFNTICD